MPRTDCAHRSPLVDVSHSSGTSRSCTNFVPWPLWISSELMHTALLVHRSLKNYMVHAAVQLSNTNWVFSSKIDMQMRLHACKCIDFVQDPVIVQQRGSCKHAAQWSWCLSTLRSHLQGHKGVESQRSALRQMVSTSQEMAQARLVAAYTQT